jgi:hypothetical protein
MRTSHQSTPKESAKNTHAQENRGGIHCARYKSLLAGAQHAWKRARFLGKARTAAAGKGEEGLTLEGGAEHRSGEAPDHGAEGRHRATAASNWEAERRSPAAARVPRAAAAVAARVSARWRRRKERGT